MATATQTLTANPGAGAAAASGAPGAGAGGGAGTATNSPAFWDTFKDADIKGWVASKNFPDVEKALTSYRNLETLMGADKAGRTVMLPKDDNDAEGYAALAKRLGVPDTADGYKLPLPEGADDGFSKTAASWFHKAGVTPRAATQIAEAWNGWIAEQVKAAETADRAESEKQMGALEQEWGNEFTAKRELAQRGYRAFAEKFGLTDAAALERAESVLGAANLTKFFAGLGSLDSESTFAGGDKPAGFGMSMKDAQARINEIRAKRISGEINDHQWRTQYAAEVDGLGKIVAAAMARAAA